MKFVQKSLGETADLSSGQGNTIVELVKLMVLTLLLIVIVYFGVGYLTESLVSNISIENEKKWLGKLNITEFNFKQADTSDDYKVAENILERLVQHPDVSDLEYKLVVLKDPTINAFAFPGGTIGITSGLLDEIKSETSLAFVLGHELGHFKYRHHLKGFSKAITTSIIFSILFGNQSNLEFTQQIITILDRRHSQQQEKDSDNFGAKLVFDTFGTTDNIEKFFEVLQAKESHKYSIGFLSTHPSSKLRIENLRALSYKLNQQSQR